MRVSQVREILKRDRYEDLSMKNVSVDDLLQKLIAIQKECATLELQNNRKAAIRAKKYAKELEKLSNLFYKRMYAIQTEINEHHASDVRQTADNAGHKNLVTYKGDKD